MTKSQLVIEVNTRRERGNVPLPIRNVFVVGTKNKRQLQELLEQYERLHTNALPALEQEQQVSPIVSEEAKPSESLVARVSGTPSALRDADRARLLLTIASPELEWAREVLVQGKSRLQLDSHADHWEAICRKFNSRNFLPATYLSCDFSGLQGEAQRCSDTYVFAKSILKSELSSLRSRFTVAKTNWAVSGQNDGALFGDFCDHSPIVCLIYDLHRAAPEVFNFLDRSVPDRAVIDSASSGIAQRREHDDMSCPSVSSIAQCDL
eukprot:scaffold6167_cov176-Pinguiococcus_pyrenoidosus.AAC.2